MHLLIVSATQPEIKELMELVQGTSASLNGRIDILITGVGMLHTGFHLGQQLAANDYDLAINFGIAGSFRKDIKIGEVVNIVEEQVADLGAEDSGQFLNVIELGLQKPNEPPYTKGKLLNATQADNPIIKQLKKVKGISVNTVHGKQQSIEQIIHKLNPDVESMEGAAFLYSCLAKKLPCFEIRVISNYIEPRDKKNWNIPLAIKNLNQKAIEIIESLSNNK